MLYFTQVYFQLQYVNEVIIMSEKSASFDFHLHSCWSYDATCPVETYFAQAAKQGVSHIAITEHHQMDSFPEVVEASKKYPMVSYIPGAELTVHSPKGTFDMVCLGLPQVPTPELQQVFAAYHNWQRAYGDAYCALLSFEGYFYSRAERKMLLERYRPAKTIAVQGITHVQNSVQTDYLIKEKKFFPDAKKRDELIWNSDMKLPPYPEYDFVLPAVKRAGGLVFIAHPKGYFRQNDLARMDELREMLQFDGIECAHPSIPEELTPFYRQYCKDHGLLSSAGSDTHSSPDCAYQFCKESAFARHIGEKRYVEEILERIPAFHA